MVSVSWTCFSHQIVSFCAFLASFITLSEKCWARMSSYSPACWGLPRLVEGLFAPDAAFGRAPAEAVPEQGCGALGGASTVSLITREQSLLMCLPGLKRKSCGEPPARREGVAAGEQPGLAGSGEALCPPCLPPPNEASARKRGRPNAGAGKRADGRSWRSRGSQRPVCREAIFAAGGPLLPPTRPLNHRLPSFRPAPPLTRASRQREGDLGVDWRSFTPALQTSASAALLAQNKLNQQFSAQTLPYFCFACDTSLTLQGSLQLVMNIGDGKGLNFSLHAREMRFRVADQLARCHKFVTCRTGTST